MECHKYDTLKIQNQLCFPLYVCAKETIRLYKPFLDELELTYTQYITMMVLWEKKRLTLYKLLYKLLTYMEKEEKTEDDFWGSTLCAAFFFADFMV